MDSTDRKTRAAIPLFNRIELLRVERRLSRQALAEAVGVNYQTIGYLERGEWNPSLELALRIAEFFGLPVEAIFSRRPFSMMSAELYPKPNHQKGTNP